VRLAQFDVARLTDDGIRSLVLALDEGSAKDPGAVAAFFGILAGALRRVLADRRRMFAVAALDADEDEAEGNLVEPGTDPVADALAELRRGFPDGPVS
jgi:hypothetical protein